MIKFVKSKTAKREYLFDVYMKEKRYYQILHKEKVRFSGKKKILNLEFSTMLIEKDCVLCGIRGHIMFLNDALDNMDEAPEECVFNDFDKVVLQWNAAESIIRDNSLQFISDAHSPFSLGTVIFIDSYVAGRKIIDEEIFSYLIRALKRVAGNSAIVWVVSKPPVMWFKTKCNIYDFIKRKEIYHASSTCFIKNRDDLNRQYVSAILKRTKRNMEQCKIKTTSNLNVIYDPFFLELCF